MLYCTTKHNGKMYFFANCKKICANQLLYERHKLKCKIKTRNLVPKKILFFFFEKYKNKLFCPINIYANIKAILKPYKTNNLIENSNKNIYQSHKALGIGYYLVSHNAPEKSYYRSFRGANVGKWFAKQLYNIALLHAYVSIFIIFELLVNTLRCRNCAS